VGVLVWGRGVSSRGGASPAPVSLSRRRNRPHLGARPPASLSKVGLERPGAARPQGGQAPPGLRAPSGSGMRAGRLGSASRQKRVGSRCRLCSRFAPETRFFFFFSLGLGDKQPVPGSWFGRLSARAPCRLSRHRDGVARTGTQLGSRVGPHPKSRRGLVNG
jgi:hypothetical protein